MVPEIPFFPAAPLDVKVPNMNADANANSVKTTHFEWGMSPPFVACSVGRSRWEPTVEQADAISRQRAKDP
jgi:hypothetical protein